jgi:uncharacterized membrane protein YbhN (UPF0104 family)
MPVAWWAVLRGMGTTHRLLECFEVHALTNMAKYVPGSVWPVLGRTAMLSGERGVAFASAAAEMTLKVVGALVVSLLFLSERFGATLPPAAFGLALVAALLVVHPRVFIPLAGVVNRVLGGEVETPRDVHYPWFAVAMALSISTWLLFGVAFGLFVRAFGPVELTPLIGVFSLAWVSGFLAVPVPAGLGVREGVLAISLSPLLGEPLAIGVSLASRIWWMVGDLGFFSLGVAVRSARAARWTSSSASHEPLG